MWYMILTAVTMTTGAGGVEPGDVLSNLWHGPYASEAECREAGAELQAIMNEQYPSMVMTHAYGCLPVPEGFIKE